MPSHTFPVFPASHDPGEQLVAVDVELRSSQGSFIARLIIDTGTSRVLLTKTVLNALHLPVANRPPWRLTTATGDSTSPVYLLEAFSIVDANPMAPFKLTVADIQELGVGELNWADNEYPETAGVLGWLPLFTRICVDKETVELWYDEQHP